MKLVSVFLALGLAATAFGKETTSPAETSKEPDKIVVLEPYTIKTTPLSSFAVDIRIYTDPDAKKVDRIFITRVLEDTDAERAGLQAGDEIIRLDGTLVKEMDSRIAPDSPLGRIFMNRDPGDYLTLEVITRRPQKITLRAQRGLPGPKH